MVEEKPTYGVLVLSDGLNYIGVNISDGEKMFQSRVSVKEENACQYVGLVHALMLIRKNNLPLVAYSVSDIAIKYVSEKLAVNFGLPENKPMIDRCCRWIVFGSKKYFPWKWKSDQWGSPFEMLKKETK